MSAGNIKIIVTVAWLALLAMLVGRDMFVPQLDSRETVLLTQAEQQRFYGVWFNQVRIGYVAETLLPDEEGYSLEQEAHLLLNVLETTQPIDMQVRARLTKGLLLRDFSFSFSSPFYMMNAEGKVDGNRVTFELDTGQAKITDTVVLSQPPILALNNRAYLLARLTEEGQKVKIPSFDPATLAARESVVTYEGKEKILVRNRVRLLHHFTEIASGMRISFWLDDNGRVVKEESPAGFQFIAEPEFRAKDIAGAGNELLRSVAVARRGPLLAPGARTASYQLTLPPDLALDLEGGRQSITGDLLRVALEGPPSEGNLQNGGSCATPEALDPSPYVQSDDREIAALAQEIVGPEGDTFTRIRLLADWVHDNLEKRPVIGLPDALTTLRSRKGDCNEHASLFAALARSLAIPTVIATGVTLQEDAFYYHAWNEVCLGGNWYSLDTTTGQMPADLYHIRFGRGDLDQQIKIGGLLGRLQIELLPPPE